MRSWEDQVKMLASTTNLLYCLKIAQLMACKILSHKVQEMKRNVLFYFILFVFSSWYPNSDAMVYISKTVPLMYQMKVLAILGGNLRSCRDDTGHLNTVQCKLIDLGILTGCWERHPCGEHDWLKWTISNCTFSSISFCLFFKDVPLNSDKELPPIVAMKYADRPIENHTNVKGRHESRAKDLTGNKMKGTLMRLGP